MLPESLVYKFAELFLVLCQQPCPFLERNALRAISAVVYCVARCLVGKKFNVDVIVKCILQKVYDISFVGDRKRLPFIHCFLCPFEGLRKILCSFADPSLAVPCLYSGRIYLSDYRSCSCDLCCFGLCSAHSAQSRGDEKVSCKTLALRKMKLASACVEKRIVCAVNYTLRTYVHPSACRHLSVICYSQCSRPCKILRVVEHAHHKAVRQYDPGSRWVGTEKAQRVT